MINIKYCKKCNEAFDQQIDYEICGKCRGERVHKEKQEELE